MKGMFSILFFILGFAITEILKSAGIGFDMWQFYGVVGCWIASIILTGIAMLYS